MIHQVIADFIQSFESVKHTHIVLITRLKRLSVYDRASESMSKQQDKFKVDLFVY